MATSRVPPREIRKVKKIDQVQYVKVKEDDDDRSEKKTVTTSRLVACVPTRCCIRCERSDLYCDCPR